MFKKYYAFILLCTLIFLSNGKFIRSQNQNYEQDEDKKNITGKL
jgi:hypothetical protein